MDVEDFIRDYIPSIWALELILVLERGSGQSWTPAALVRELRASARLVDDNLARFERHGLALQGPDGWQFRPANAQLAALVQGLVSLYRERPMHVIGLINRSDAIRSLADAFRIRKDET